MWQSKNDQYINAYLNAPLQPPATSQAHPPTSQDQFRGWTPLREEEEMLLIYYLSRGVKFRTIPYLIQTKTGGWYENQQSKAREIRAQELMGGRPDLMVKGSWDTVPANGYIRRKLVGQPWLKRFLEWEPEMGNVMARHEGGLWDTEIDVLDLRLGNLHYTIEVPNIEDLVSDLGLPPGWPWSHNSEHALSDLGLPP